MSENIRLLIVDDHFIIREGLRLIFDTIPNLDLVAEAENGEEALVQVEDHLPDVILMDLQMPVMDGITTICKTSNSRSERGFSKSFSSTGFSD